MDEIKVEGSITESRVVKEGGQVVHHESEQGGDGILATHQCCGNLFKTGFSAGRTIELRQFEFCRVKLKLVVRVPKDVGRDDTEKAVDNFTLEMLAREEAAVSGRQYEVNITDETKEILSKCICRCVELQYGLTLKSATKKFESHQVDIIRELPVSDNVDLIESFESLSTSMADRLNSHHERIKGIGSDTGM